MAGRESIRLVFSYAHKDEDHHRRLAAELDRLVEERWIDRWDDRQILPGTEWDEEIRERFAQADIIVLLISPALLDSQYVRENEIPQAVAQAKAHHSVLLPVILEDDPQRNWLEIEGLAAWQALPPTATPIDQWPSRDVAYAEVARGVRAVAEGLRKGVYDEVERRRATRDLTIFPQYPLRILGEGYDPFHALEQVFRRVENGQLRGLEALPLATPLGRKVDFVRRPYRSILTELRHGDARTGLPYDLAAIPYWLLGHCVEAGLLQPLDDDLRESLGHDFTWWHEMGEHEGRLYGVPLSALTMVLAIRKDLFDAHGLTPPDTWEQYLAVVDQVAEQPIPRGEDSEPIAPDLLQGRCHITLWYHWLNHLYAHDSNDRELYGGNRYPPREAAETLRAGTKSYLELAGKLAGCASGAGHLPHYATANWDDGIEMFADGRLLMHFLFTDALETLRTRMEVASQRAGHPIEVRYLPVPRSFRSGVRHGRVEGWILCVPRESKYERAANAVLKWFLDVEIQRSYASWGGSSAHRTIIAEQAKDGVGGGAGRAYRESVRAGLDGEALVKLVKYKGARALPAIDRIVANLYDAVLAVGRGRAAEEASDALIRSVETRLLKGRA